ncbi:hypothetical protein [Kibdelosporangium aridum]|nr:hypothetical protein [Kibdelosporangium aridum]
MVVVEVFVFTEYVEQVSLVPDERSVERFVAAGLDPTSMIEFMLGI